MAGMVPGTVHLVGAGPGDPDLVTVRAAELISGADDLVVDALVPPAIYASSRARIVHVGKRAGRPGVSQAEIGDILVRLARAGRRVVRLQGGDASVFGRLAEEMAALDEAGVRFEVVPGVTSALAAPLSLGAVATERFVADRVVVTTGRRGGAPDGRRRLPPWDDRQTVVVLMALGVLERLVEEALELGYPPDLPAAVVSHATLATERSVASPLASLPAEVDAAALETPATLVIGSVVRDAVRRSEISERATGARRQSR